MSGPDEAGKIRTLIYDGAAWRDGPTVSGGYTAKLHNTHRLIAYSRVSEGTVDLHLVGAGGLGPATRYYRFGIGGWFFEEPDAKVLQYGYDPHRGGVNLEWADGYRSVLVRSMPHEPRQTYVLSSFNRWLDSQHTVLDVQSIAPDKCTDKDFKAFTLQDGVVYLSDGISSIFARDPRTEYLFPLHERNTTHYCRNMMFTQGSLVGATSEDGYSQLHVTDIRSPNSTHNISLPRPIHLYDTLAIFCA